MKVHFPLQAITADIKVTRTVLKAKSSSRLSAVKRAMLIKVQSTILPEKFFVEVGTNAGSAGALERKQRKTKSHDKRVAGLINAGGGCLRGTQGGVLALN